MITSVRVTKNEVRIRNKKVVYRKKIRKMGLEDACDDSVVIVFSTLSFNLSFEPFSPLYFSLF
jgi:hypothetical protein